MGTKFVATGNNTMITVFYSFLQKNVNNSSENDKLFSLVSCVYVYVCMFVSVCVRVCVCVRVHVNLTTQRTDAACDGNYPNGQLCFASVPPCIGIKCKSISDMLNHLCIELSQYVCINSYQWVVAIQ